MNMYKSVLRSIVGAVSVVSFLAIWTQPVEIATTIAFALLAVAMIFYKSYRESFPELHKADTRYIVCSMVVCMVTGVLFYFNYVIYRDLGLKPSGHTLFVLAVMMCVAVLAIPATASFAKGLLGVNSSKSGHDEPRRCGLLHNPFFIGMAVTVFALVAMIVSSFSYCIHFDESFTLSLIEHSYQEVLSLTAADVHPPLYYLILKAVVDGVASVLPAVPAVFVAKLTSVLPYIICVLVFAFKVRRDWGGYVAGLGAACMVCMGRLIEYGINIRMYGLGMLFVTLAFLYACDIMYKNKRAAWILFYVFSLCAFYTHYFAGVAIGFLFLVLLICLWKRNRKQVKYVLLAALLIVVGYLPWLRILVVQLQTVGESFWIPAITPATVGGYMIHIFVSPLLAGITLLLAIVLYKKQTRCASCRPAMVCSYMGILTPLWVVTFGVAVSLLVRPVFVMRYAVPALACMWLGLVIMAQSIGSNHIKKFLSLLIVTICIGTILSFVYTENQSRINTDKARQFMSLNKSAVYIGGPWTPDFMRAFSYLSGSKCYLFGGDNTGLYYKVFTNTESVSSVDEIKDMLTTEKDAYLVVSCDDTSLLDSLRANNVECSYVEEYILKREKGKFYHLRNTD